MDVILNGDARTIPGDTVSIADIPFQSEVGKPETISLQLDGEFVDPRDYRTTLVKQGDEMDFLYFLGGGSARCVAALHPL